MKVALIAMAGYAAASIHADDHDAIRAAFIDQLNAIDGTWTAGLSERFAGLPLGAGLKSLTGVKEESLAAHHAAIANGDIILTTEEADNIPDAFDSATNWPECASIISDIRDQSACGCCWAFAAAEAASDRLCISTGGKTKFPLSAQDVCFCGSSNGCDGGMLFQAWSQIQSDGVVTGGQVDGSGYCSDYSLPHCHHHGPEGHGGDPYPSEGTPGCPNVNDSPSCPSACDANANSTHADFASDKWSFRGIIASPGSERAIQTSIMSSGPVEAAFDVYADFENYVGGVYSHKSGSYMGGHAIKIVGWGVDSGTKYWKIANSWNPYWGENGYFRIKRGTNECSIESQVTSSQDGTDWYQM